MYLDGTNCTDAARIFSVYPKNLLQISLIFLELFLTWEAAL
jgi:hypothetical protein